MNVKLLTSNAAANYLNVSRSSLTNWLKQGLLEYSITPGGHYRFTVKELDKFAKNKGLAMQTTSNEEQEVEQLKILIIDDDNNFREFVRDALNEFLGYSFQEAEDGIKGVLLSGSWQPDLIILDIRMPNMNGVEFLKHLRDNPDTKHIKVIVSSAYLSEDVKKKLNKLNVKIILEKPVRLVKLVAAIEKATNLQLS